MEAYIKDNQLIINTMIRENEKEMLLDFIDKATEKGVDIKTLYNIKGDKSGIAFSIKEGE